MTHNRPSRFVDPSLEIAVKELHKAIEWRDRSLSYLLPSDTVTRQRMRSAMRSQMRRHALDSRRSFAGQLLYAGPDPRNAGPLPLADLPR